MIAYLRREMKPKDIRLYPEELLSEEFNEYTLIRNWLKYVHWYYSTESVSIEEFFDAPICASTYKKTMRDESLVRFGYLWKLYDMAAGWTMSTTPPFVFDTATVVEFPFWVRGGSSGTDFLLSPVVLEELREVSKSLKRRESTPPCECEVSIPTSEVNK